MPTDVTTRTFFRSAGETRAFLEISWSGPEVETTTGKVGSSGRTLTRSFETADERDAWLAQRIAKAQREGFIEGNPADVPVPDPEADSGGEAREAKRLLAQRGVPAYLPRVSLGDDDLRSSKIGGTPWLNEPWPTCPACTQAQRLVVQLARDEVPASCRWAFRSDLLQLFLCDAAGKPGDPDWLCQAEGGWEAYARSTRIRHVALAAEPMSIEAALPELVRVQMARLEHECLAAHMVRTGDPAPPEATAFALAERAAQLLVVPSSDQEFFVSRALRYPPQRVTHWDEALDNPAYGDLTLAEGELLEQQLGRRCLAGHKLAGAPAWAQDPAPARCRACRLPMQYLFQVTTSGPIDIGGDGIGWLFVCRKCQDATFTWQR